MQKCHAANYSRKTERCRRICSGNPWHVAQSNKMNREHTSVPEDEGREDLQWRRSRCNNGERDISTGPKGARDDSLAVGILRLNPAIR
jgi:hypothetical protein